MAAAIIICQCQSCGDRVVVDRRTEDGCHPESDGAGVIIYKSLFTENSAATQKQYSTSVNTNKIQNTTIKSITSSFFTKLNYLLHLVAKLAKAIHCGNVSYYKLVLPFLRSQLFFLSFPPFLHLPSWITFALTTISLRPLICGDVPLVEVILERKCADTIGTVPVPCAGHFQC